MHQTGVGEVQALANPGSREEKEAERGLVQRALGEDASRVRVHVSHKTWVLGRTRRKVQCGSSNQRIHIPVERITHCCLRSATTDIRPRCDTSRESKSSIRWTSRASPTGVFGPSRWFTHKVGFYRTRCCQKSRKYGSWDCANYRIDRIWGCPHDRFDRHWCCRDSWIDRSRCGANDRVNRSRRRANDWLNRSRCRPNYGFYSQGRHRFSVEQQRRE